MDRCYLVYETIKSSDFSRDVVKKCRENGVAVTLASYLENEIHAPQPSIRLAIQTGLTNDQLIKIVKIV